jgi:hypothetical protein
MSRKQPDPVDDWETSYNDDNEPSVPVQILARPPAASNTAANVQFTFTSALPMPMPVPVEPPQPQMMILQRPSSANSERASKVPPKQERTLAQRQEEYKQARERIFGKDASPADKPQVTVSRTPIQPDSEARGFKRNKPKT